MFNNLKGYDKIKQIHGFYVDEKTQNVYFDLIIDFSSNNSENIKKEIINKMEEKYSQYKFNVILDADYSD